MPRILFIDIETAPVIIAAWPPLYETNAIWIERPSYILGFSAMWAWQKRPKWYSLPDYPSFKKNIHDDKALCGDLHRILSECDLVVAQNGDKFDLKMIKGRCWLNNYPPLPRSPSVDTLKIMRSEFKLDGYGLDAVGRARGFGGKRPNTGKDLWRDCTNGVLSAFGEMGRYCNVDVIRLAQLYHDIKPFAKSHPNLSVITERPGCPVCQSRRVQQRGFNIARTRKTPRLHCQSCGHWFSGIKNESARTKGRRRVG